MGESQGPAGLVGLPFLVLPCISGVVNSRKRPDSPVLSDVTVRQQRAGLLITSGYISRAMGVVPRVKLSLLPAAVNKKGRDNG